MATFYIEAVENTNIALVMVGSPTIGTVKYGVNDTTCPNTYTVTAASIPISLTAGQKCYWTITSTSTNFSDSNYIKFTSTTKINVGGNLSDLIGGESQIPRNYCFCKLFDNCTNLVSASNLVVVNNFNSKTYCYQYMFNGCTSLTTAPALPATTLAWSCYYYMFQNCTSLTTAPALPAATLATNCYLGMFSGCTSLTTAPALPATTLADDCYYTMFKSCTSLTTPPELPVTTLADYCYYRMFYGCTSLTTVPELPATTLTSYCYKEMFSGCTNIKLSTTQIAPYSIPYRIPSEGAGTEGTDSLTDMFTATGGTFKGTPTINTIYYIPKFYSNVQLYDADIKLYPITKAENVSGLNNVISGAIADQKGAANGVASLGSDGKVPSGQLPAMDYIPTAQKGVANGVASLGSDGKVPSGQLPAMDYIPTSQKGAASGVASLGSDGKVPTSQIPSLSYIPTSQKGAANGVVSLGADGKVLISQLPIYDGTVI